MVDWKNSTTDLRFNSLYLVNLLEYLKSITTDDEQFVIMGESMGGLIARYTLTFMESRSYEIDDYDGFFQDAFDINNIGYLLLHLEIYDLPTTIGEKDRMHNTRLLITLDSPHQGANVPLSVQYAYRTALGIFGPYIGTALTISASLMNLGLDGQAAQQMLIYHIDTKYGSPWYYDYTSMPDKNLFFSQLLNMGNYPQYAKIVAMSSGSLKGYPQTNYYTGEDRVAGDYLIDFEADLYARVLWIPVPIFGGDLECQTNPNGNGHIFKANAGTYGITIKLKWFGIKVTFGYNSLLSVDEYAHTLPYCTSSGGYYYPGFDVVDIDAAADDYDLSQSWILNVFAWEYENDGLGCFTFNSHAGWNGFASINADLSLCSDGSNFDFIPVQSAIDYGTLGTYPLNLDIETQSISTKLSRVKADVVTGIPDAYAGNNYNHLFYRNDDIYNITDAATSPYPYFYTYYTCDQAGINEVERGFLNLEIGDEELYLENVTLPWTAKYQTEYNIRVNKRNPHYQYAGVTTTPLTLVGIYSKKALYSVTSPGYANFYVDATATPKTPAFLASSLSPSLYSVIDEPLYICCLDFRGTRLAEEQQPLPHDNEEDYLLAYPNPTDGKLLLINYQMPFNADAVISISNSFGNLVYQARVERSMDKVNYASLDLSFLPAGLYIINLKGAKQRMSTKILIIK